MEGKRVSDDSGFHSDKVYAILDPKLLHTSGAPPNLCIPHLPHPKAKFAQNVDFVDENNNELAKKTDSFRREPIDYTVIAGLAAVPVPFLGVPAYWFSRKCRHEVTRGDLKKAWEYSWIALYFVLASLFFLGLIFAGALVVFAVNLVIPYNQHQPSPTTNQMAATTTRALTSTTPVATTREQTYDKALQDSVWQFFDSGHLAVKNMTKGSETEMEFDMHHEYRGNNKWQTGDEETTEK